MKLSNHEIINRMNILTQFSETRLPQKISYAITRNLSILQKEYKCYLDELNKLFDRFKDDIETDDAGNIKRQPNGIPKFKGPVPETFNEDLSDLLNIEIDVEVFLIPSELFNYDDTRFDSLTGKDIALLQSVLCE